MTSVTPHIAATRLGHDRNELLRSTLAAGSIPNDFSRQLTRLTDRYFQARIAEVHPRSDKEAQDFSNDALTVLAVGGYGGQTLCPHSDLDVLVLFRDAVPEFAGSFCQSLFLPLWDLGLELGHGVRSLAECLKLAAQDQATFTALLSARYLAGNRALMREFAEAFIHQAAHHDLAKLAAIFDPPGRTEQTSQNQNTEVTPTIARHLAEFDFDLSAENLLEPNLKSTPGGLRDYHRLHWLAVPRLADQGTRVTTSPAGPFSDGDISCLHQDVAFLLQTRTALHLTLGRKADALYLELQPEVARLLGFVKPDTGLAVEVFLGRLHRAMERIRAMYLSVLRSIRSLEDPAQTVRLLRFEREQGVTLAADGLTLTHPSASPPRTPSGKQIMTLFRAMGRTKLPLSWTVRSGLASACPTLLQDLGERFATFQELAGILTAPGGRQVGRAMLSSGILAALIPELGRVQDHIQFDAYHLRPLGAHTMETVGFLSDWRNQGGRGGRSLKESREATLAAEVWHQLPDPTALVLGALLHDVGKGNSDHAVAGAEMAASILGRFQAPESLIHETTFLVREHLLLFKTATRKDLHDEQVVAACAERIGERTRLERLFLLSMADAWATGPKAWNEWTAALLRDLYFKVRKILVHGPLSEPQARNRARETRETVAHRLLGADAPPHLDNLLEKLPVRYLLTTPTETIIRHIRLVTRLQQETAEERIRIPGGRGGLGLAEVDAISLPDMGCHAVTFAVMARPGIFPVLCGVLTLHELNILAAEMITWPDDVVLTMFQTQAPPDPLHLEELTFRLKQAVKYAMTGKLFLAQRLAEKRSSQVNLSGPLSTLPPAIHINIDANDFSTQIEIIADNRPGRLYQIADTLENHQVRIIRAKIATQADRIADSFDIRDQLGQKITDPNHLRAIREALLLALN